MHAAVDHVVARGFGSSVGLLVSSAAWVHGRRKSRLGECYIGKCAKSAQDAM